MGEQVPCPTCGIVDDPSIPGEHLCSLMRRLTPEEQAATEFSQETKERLWAFMDEADRCRNRGAVEARSFWIG